VRHYGLPTGNRYKGDMNSPILEVVLGLHRTVISSLRFLLEFSPLFVAQMKSLMLLSWGLDCLVCFTALICIADADYVLCPERRVVGPTGAAEREMPPTRGFNQPHRGGVGPGPSALFLNCRRRSRLGVKFSGKRALLFKMVVGVVVRYIYSYFKFIGTILISSLVLGAAAPLVSGDS
jgi:hypothetical protein